MQEFHMIKYTNQGAGAKNYPRVYLASEADQRIADLETENARLDRASDLAIAGSLNHFSNSKKYAKESETRGQRIDELEAKLKLQDEIIGDIDQILYEYDGSTNYDRLKLWTEKNLMGGE